jgi:hypothetical protein
MEKYIDFLEKYTYDAKILNSLNLNENLKEVIEERDSSSIISYNATDLTSAINMYTNELSNKPRKKKNKRGKN